MPTTNPVPSQDPSDLLFNAGKLDEVVSGSNATYTDRLGVSRRTMAGVDAAADVVLSGLGYAPPVAYAAGIALTLTTQTVEYAGEVYAPKVSNLPFTTSGTFETAKFRLIQGLASADLSAPSGSSLVGYDGQTVQDVLDAVTGPTGAASVGYTPSGVGAVATTVQSKLRESVSVKDFLAVGDGVTDDTAAFITMESSTIDDFYLPEGVYYTTLWRTQLKKHYYGPGVIRQYASATQSDFISGENEFSLVGRKPFLQSPLSSQYLTQRPIVFIGDSITAGGAMGAPDGPSYPEIIQNYIGSKLAYPTNTFLNGTDIEYQGISASGPVTLATTSVNGIVGFAYQMQPGARLVFSSFNSDYFGFWFTRSVGSGKIQKYRNTVLIETVDCAGAALSHAFSGYGAFSRQMTLGISECTYWLDCIDGPVEIVGLFAIPATAPKSVPIMVQARGGWRTSDFISDASIDGIAKQLSDLHPADGHYQLCVIALGTNDTYSGPNVATYESNLTTIVTKLLAKSIIPVLQVPLRSTLNPVGGTFEQYRAAAYRVAQGYRLDICDLSDLDLETHGAMTTDRLHPNWVGHQIMASRWIDFLRLSDMQPTSYSSNLTLLNGATTTAGFAVPSCTVSPGGVVTLKGTIDITGQTAGTSVFELPNIAKPFLARAITCQTIVGNGFARVNIASGIGTLEYYSAGARPGYICLDGVSFSIQ